MSGAAEAASRASRRHHQDARYQSAADQDVAQGNDQGQPQPVADLGGGHHQRGPARTDVEVSGDQRQQRLGVVEVGGRNPAGHGEQRHHGRGHARWHARCPGWAAHPARRRPGDRCPWLVQRRGPGPASGHTVRGRATLLVDSADGSRRRGDQGEFDHRLDDQPAGRDRASTGSSPFPTPSPRFGWPASLSSVGCCSAPATRLQPPCCSASWAPPTGSTGSSPAATTRCRRWARCSTRWPTGSWWSPR